MILETNLTKTPPETAGFFRGRIRFSHALLAPLTLKSYTPDMNVIVKDPEILGGIPVFAGTRVPVKNLFDALIGGDSIPEFLDDFPTVTFEQVREVLEDAEHAVENPVAA